jgi:hypothetical protein
VNEEEYRSPTAWELAVLDRLLELPFPGRDEVRRQVDGARVRTVREYGDDYGSIDFLVSNWMKAPVVMRVPVVGTARDVDGVPIEFLLHIVDGIISELEIVKMDGGAIIEKPDAASVEVTLQEEI